MKVELTIDSMKEMPKTSVSVLEKVLLKGLGDHYENCSLRVRCVGSDGLSVPGGEKQGKKSFLDTSESAEEWFY